MKANTQGSLVSIAIAVWLAGCPTLGAVPDYQALVANPDRSEADRKTDVRRKPEQLHQVNCAFSLRLCVECSLDSGYAGMGKGS